MPLAGRLDALLRAADQGGMSTSRRELVAAIVHGAPVSPRALRAIVSRYRSADIADALVAGQPTDAVLTPLRTPGPRQRRLFDLPEPSEMESLFSAKEEARELLRQLLSATTAVRIGIELPPPLIARLDSLVRRFQSQRGTVSRQQLLAALVLAAPEAPRAVAKLLLSYRRATISDTMIRGDDPNSYLGGAAPKRGRPARSTARNQSPKSSS